MSKTADEPVAWLYELFDRREVSLIQYPSRISWTVTPLFTLAALTAERSAREKAEAEVKRLTPDPRQVVGGGFVQLSDYDAMEARAEKAERERDATWERAIKAAADLCDRYRHPDGSTSGLASSLATAILALPPPEKTP